MDDFVRKIYLGELASQLKAAISSADAARATLKERFPKAQIIMGYLDDFLDHAGRAALILWPTQGDQKRGEFLRNLLKVSDDNVLKNKTLRNRLQHFDEHIDAWEKRSKNRIYIDNNVGPRGTIVVPGGGEAMRHFIPTDETYLFVGEEYSLRPIYDAASALLKIVEQLGH